MIVRIETTKRKRNGDIIAGGIQDEPYEKHYTPGVQWALKGGSVLFNRKKEPYFKLIFRQVN